MAKKSTEPVIVNLTRLGQRHAFFHFCFNVFRRKKLSLILRFINITKECAKCMIFISLNFEYFMRTT